MQHRNGLENGESLCHLVSEGKEVAKQEYIYIYIYIYIKRHDNVPNISHWKLCELTSWRGRKNGVVKVHRVEFPVH